MCYPAATGMFQWFSTKLIALMKKCSGPYKLMKFKSQGELLPVQYPFAQERLCSSASSGKLSAYQNCQSWIVWFDARSSSQRTQQFIFQSLSLRELHDASLVTRSRAVCTWRVLPGTGTELGHVKSCDIAVPLHTLP